MPSPLQGGLRSPSSKLTDLGQHLPILTELASLVASPAPLLSSRHLGHLLLSSPGTSHLVCPIRLVPLPHLSLVIAHCPFSSPPPPEPPNAQAHGFSCHTPACFTWLPALRLGTSPSLPPFHPPHPCKITPLLTLLTSQESPSPTLLEPLASQCGGRGDLLWSFKSLSTGPRSSHPACMHQPPLPAGFSHTHPALCRLQAFADEVPSSQDSVLPFSTSCSLAHCKGLVHGGFF